MITKITIENFKGISNPITIPLRPITLFFGKNSSGKSTILQAMLYALEVIRTANVDIDKVNLGGDAINLGGFRNLVHKHETDRVIKLRFDLNFSSVKWNEVFPIDEYLFLKEEKNIKQQIDLSDVGDSVESGWIQLSIGTDKEAGFDIPQVLNWEIGLDGIWFARVGSWGSRNQLEKGNELVQNIRIILNEIHPVLALPGEESGEMTGNIYGRYGRDTQSALYEMYFNSERFVLDHKNTHKSLLQQLKYHHSDELSKSFQNTKICVLTEEKDFVENSFQAALMGDKNVVEIGILSESKSLGVYRVFLNNTQSSSDEIEIKRIMLQLMSVDEFPIITSVNGCLPDWKRPFSTGWPLSGMRRTSYKDSEEGNFTSSIIDAHFLNQMLYRLCIGPLILLRDELSDMRYLGPIREIPPRNYALIAKREESRWSNGLGAWDSLYDSKATFEKANEYIDNTLNLGYKVIRDEVLELESNSAIFKQFDDLEEWQFRHIFKEYIDSLPRKIKLSLFDSKNEVEVALCDVGVGISQVIPVVVGAIAPLPSEKQPSIFAIEQPELHIHSAVQCGLGDLFIREKSEKRIFLIETHSEHLLLRIMKRMRQSADKKLPADIQPVEKQDVAVMFVEIVDDNMFVREMPLNERGELVKAWPGGFFEEGLEEVF